jgi:ATP-binding cassette subfamily F protein uup
MANLVNLEAVSVLLPQRAVLDQVSLGVQSGDRIGVLGLNGSGKTTLLDVLGGLRRPEAGRVATARGTRIETVSQTSDLPDGITVRDAALHTFGDVGEHVWASDSAVREVLTGLGLGSIGLDTVVDTLSGGERRRVALAAALVTDADLLLLDEPTNHLDIEGIAWLAAHLVARRSAVVAVTHDRWFLDAVAALTWEVVDGGVQIREGGYSDWVFARAERLRLDRAAEERRRNLARKELAWLRRGPPARTSKPRYRIEAAETLIADVPEPRNSVELHSFALRRLGKDVLDLEGVTVTVPATPSSPARGELPSADRTARSEQLPVGRQRKLLDDVTWRLGPGDRIGVVGVNGSGKSTLLRVLVGERPADVGLVKRGRTVRLGYLSQEAVELPGALRLLEAVSEIAGTVNLGGRDLTAGQLAERFGFPASQHWTPVAELSGGERRRLQLLRILMAEPNVLVLDEPTNDLDTDTLAALEDLLDGWPGTLVVVSHDRYLVERVTDDVLALFGDGKLTHLPGGIDEYLRRRATAVPAPGPAAGRPGLPGPAAAVPAPGPDGGEVRAMRKELQRLEKRLESLQRKESGLHDRLATVGADFAAAAELDAELRAVLAEKDDVEGDWLAVAEQLES